MLLWLSSVPSANAQLCRYARNDFGSFCCVIETLAVVTFLNHFDEKRHVNAVRDIKDFVPSNDSDFDKRATYSAFWHDPVDDEDPGFNQAEILILTAVPTYLKIEGISSLKSPRAVKCTD
ncbi:hypothetical protein HPB51_029265 [Rhipicephalus microplus]|uniref:Uncharacterized protein n=1 Tax=Rhipicephalus microplus TaxID=6941 RepID=A0A9J6CUJ4_RHIMP|nr:hypothetical protein HPB51_029265 [Rhipicephalus microplus]